MESQTIQELEALTPVEMDAGLVFSGVPTGNTIWGFQNPCLYTPVIDPHYSFHESATEFWKVRRCACRKTVGKSFIRMKCSVSPARAIPMEEGTIRVFIREPAE